MRRIIIYTTDTGTTKQVTDILSSSIECDVLLVNSHTEYNPEDFNKYSDFIIGTPVHYAAVHPDVKKLLQCIDFTGRKVFPFILFGGICASIKAEFNQLCHGARMYEMLKVLTDSGIITTPIEDIQKWAEYVKSNSIVGLK